MPQRPESIVFDDGGRFGVQSNYAAKPPHVVGDGAQKFEKRMQAKEVQKMQERRDI